MPAEAPEPPLASVTPNFVARGERALSVLEWINLAATLIHLALDGQADPADAHHWLDALTETLRATLAEPEQ
ncbi:MAG TPA: hypothetical protein VHX38_41720 [Pseudonocardiaceae bacterium]|jgi:hypothetical protein|nr:hypothetical protein [Pseudonocardiaceae bacterium]